MITDNMTLEAKNYDVNMMFCGTDNVPQNTLVLILILILGHFFHV